MRVTKCMADSREDIRVSDGMSYQKSLPVERTAPSDLKQLQSHLHRALRLDCTQMGTPSVMSPEGLGEDKLHRIASHSL